MCFIIKLLICGPFFFFDLTTTKLTFLQKKAVSTSHCSQPNTIEYDLALEWMLVREKQERKITILHKVDTILLKICIHVIAMCHAPGS
jgi:hypothetical protein